MTEPPKEKPDSPQRERANEGVDRPDQRVEVYSIARPRVAPSWRRKPGWMPIWPDQLLAEFASISTEVWGPYVALLCHYWRSAGPLPDSDHKLALLAGVKFAHWRKLRASVEPLFNIAGGLWHHEHLDHELARYAQVRKQKQRAARTRWRDQQ